MSPSPASRQPGAWFVVKLGLFAAIFVVAGMMRTGVEVPGGEVLVAGAAVFLLWDVVRRWRVGDAEQRQAVAEYRAWAESQIEHQPDD